MSIKKIPTPTQAKVLIVDDEALGAKILGERVTELGHEVCVVNDWSSAVRAFDEKIDLVLMDVVIPEVDGFKLTRLLRQKSSLYCPIVLVTGRDDPASKEKGLAAGADDFLTKPVEPIELKTRLAAMLRIRTLTKELHTQAHIDRLTGIGNRLAFDHEWRKRTAETNRYRKKLSLLMCDVDHFKKVNDTFGHDEGDLILQILGKVLRDTVRESDRAFRFGGEEFVILLPETDLDGAVLLAERLREKINKETRVSKAGPQTMSIGIVHVPSDATVKSHDVLKRADELLYDAKRDGRDCVKSSEMVKNNT